MGWDAFAHHFPVAYSHFDDLFGGKPHESFSRPEGIKQARKACCKIAGKKMAACPVSLPFFTLFGAGLSLLKLAELSGRAVALICYNKNRRDRFIANAKQAADYLMVTGILPVKMVAEIVKLVAAAIFNPRIYFIAPELFPIGVQESYFVETMEREFYRFRIAKELTLQNKAEVHEIDKAHQKIVAGLELASLRVEFLKNLKDILRNVEKEALESRDLDEARFYCKKFAEDHGKEIEFVIPFASYSLDCESEEEYLTGELEDNEEEGDETEANSSDESDFLSYSLEESSEEESLNLQGAGEVVVEVGLVGDKNLVVEKADGDDGIDDS